MARHELNGGLEVFLSAATWLLNNGGRFAVIYLAERLSELLTQMSAAGIEPKRLRMIHPRQGESARMVMVEHHKVCALASFDLTDLSATGARASRERRVALSVPNRLTGEMDRNE